MINIINQSDFQITLIEHMNSHLIVHFNKEWYQEDIADLYSLLFLSLESLNIQEKILGADRECIRFSWQSSYHFTLSFDYYSQSCWIEGVDEQSMSQVVSLLNTLQINVCSYER